MLRTSCNLLYKELLYFYSATYYKLQKYFCKWIVKTILHLHTNNKVSCLFWFNNSIVTTIENHKIFYSFIANTPTQYSTESVPLRREYITGRENPSNRRSKRWKKTRRQRRTLQADYLRLKPFKSLTALAPAWYV